MSKKKLFVSFDAPNDRALKNIIVGKSQEAGATFKVANWSSAPDTKNSNWLKDTRFKVTRCDILLIMVGENSYRAPGIIKELEFASAKNMKIIQVKAADGDVHAVIGAGEMSELDELVDLLS